MSDKPKTPNLWHSKLVKFCTDADGPIDVVIKSEPMPSKFKGNPPFIVIEVAEQEYLYSCENDAIVETLRGHRNERVMLHAGGREEAAFISIAKPGAAPSRTPAPELPPMPRRDSGHEDEDPSWEESVTTSLPKGDPAKPAGKSVVPVGAQPARHSKGTPDPSVNDEVVTALHRTAQNANGARICLRAADRIKVQRMADKELMTAEQHQGIVAMLFIEGCKDGLWRSLPTSELPATIPTKKD